MGERAFLIAGPQRGPFITVNIEAGKEIGHLGDTIGEKGGSVVGARLLRHRQGR
jgi:hypothetical protein